MVRTTDINEIAGKAALIRSNAGASIFTEPISGILKIIIALSQSHIGAGREQIWVLRACHIAMGS